ncbi:MAG TPA: hypothetical protein VMQ73_04115 [Methylomirabilota bacterium]|nr:hypothetical protein [Methylomirabilota bacterium]
MSSSTVTPRPRLSTLAGHVGLSAKGMLLVAGILAMLMRPALIDPDYYWHVEAGRWIVMHGALPVADPFSFTARYPWVTHEWLFEIFLYGVFAAGGSFAVKLMSALLGAAAVVLVYATVNKVIRRPTLAAWLAVAFYVFMYQFPSPRPQLFTYVFLATVFYVLVALKYEKDVRLLPALPLLMIVWVNAHGGYLIGVLLMGAFCATEWLVQRASPADERDRRHLRRLALTFGMVVLASLCNPLFVGLWLHPFQIMGMQATRQIAEWWSPDFHSVLGRLYLLMVGGFCALQIYRTRKPDLTEIAIPGLFIVAALTSNRHIPLAAMAMTVFAAPAVRDGLQIAGFVPAGIGRAWQTWRARAGSGKSLGYTEGLLNLAVALILVAAAAAYYPTARDGEAVAVRAALPVDAVRFILDNRIEGRPFNSYDYGGYLIHALYPQQRVFIDGRTDVYGDQFFADYFIIAAGAPDWAPLFDGYAIDYVVCQRDAPIRQLLLLRGDFRLVFDNRTSSVLVRDIPRFAAIPTVDGAQIATPPQVSP